MDADDGYGTDSNQRVIKRLKSMFFLCIQCDSPKPLTSAVMEFKGQGSTQSKSGSYVTAFFICPDCKSKFVVKIQDQGKIN